MKLLSATALVLLSSHVFPCGAFIPSKSLKKGAGLLGKTHSDMTREAWTTVAKEIFKINGLGTVMEAALVTVDNAQIAVDTDQEHAHLHFDGESFPEGQDRLIKHVADTVSSVKAGKAPQARNLLGEALHTVQDFYAHSNWIELKNKVPHPDLGIAGRTINRLPPDVATCVDCIPDSLVCPDCKNNLIKPSTGLTSGYYGGEDRVIPNVRKCSHGGPANFHRSIDTAIFGVQLLTSDGINKDSSLCALSPHWNYHSDAAAVATAASVAYIKLVTNQLSELENRLLFSYDPNFSLVNSINTAFKGFGGIRIKGPRALDLHPEASTVVARGVSDATHMIEAFGSTIRARVFEGQLHRRGGPGKRADESTPTLYDVVVEAERSSSVVVYADTSADIPAIDANHTRAVATYRDITINIFLFGQNTSPVSSEVVNLCQQTGGQVFVLQQSEISVADTIVKRLGSDNSVDILRAYDSQRNTYNFPVDSTLTNVTISISGSRTFVLTRPDGSQVTNSSTDVSTLAYSTGAFLVITTATTTIGTWKLTVTPTDGNAFSVSVGGVSFLDFDFTFVTVSGRPAHQGDQVQSSNPFSSQPVAINARIYEPFKDASFYARSLTADLNQKFNVIQGDDIKDDGGFTPDTFYNDPQRSNFTLGEDPFLVYLTGLDLAGNAFQRVQDVIYNPTQINIEAPSPNTIHPGSQRIVTFSIQNYQVFDEIFDVTILSGSGFVIPGPGQTAIQGGVTQILEVPGALAKDLTVYISIPSTATIGTDIVSVYIRGQKNTHDVNYSLTYLWVVPGDPLDDSYTWDGFSYGKNFTKVTADDKENAGADIYKYGAPIDEFVLF